MRCPGEPFAAKIKSESKEPHEGPRLEMRAAEQGEERKEEERQPSCRCQNVAKVVDAAHGGTAVTVCGNETVEGAQGRVDARKFCQEGRRTRPPESAADDHQSVNAAEIIAARRDEGHLLIRRVEIETLRKPRSLERNEFEAASRQPRAEAPGEASAERTEGIVT